MALKAVAQHGLRLDRSDLHHDRGRHVDRLVVIVIALSGGVTLSNVLNITRSGAGIFTANMTKGHYAGQVIYVHADGSQTVADSAVLRAARRRAGVLGERVKFGSAWFGDQQSHAGLDQINVDTMRIFRVRRGSEAYR